MFMRDADTRMVFNSFVEAIRFFYANGPRLVVVSLLWFLCSLPIVTSGPATLGAYAAIASLREGHHIDREHVVRTVKRHAISSALLQGVPLVFGGVAVLYARQYLATRSTLAFLLGVAAVYAAAYTALLLVPTFAGLATGDALEPALRTAVRWTARNGAAALSMGMATLLLFVITALLTIGFVVLFAGIAFSFHLETVLDPPG
ncbi:hypothetical protein [Halegenticoccus soli]|uniref:hypothetical protein n=1 Tax=Halegenticoccus soli TaxID=1985678 RepID=UPI000C6E8CBE|nr:hypothetical protein [Halegenticoccus soli]